MLSFFCTRGIITLVYPPHVSRETIHITRRMAEAEREAHFVYHREY